MTMTLQEPIPKLMLPMHRLRFKGSKTSNITKYHLPLEPAPLASLPLGPTPLERLFRWNVTVFVQGFQT